MTEWWPLGLKKVQFPGEFGGDHSCSESRDYHLPRGMQDIWHCRDTKDLLTFCIVGNSKLVDEVDPDEVDVKVVADHELTVNRFSFEFDG